MKYHFLITVLLIISLLTGCLESSSPKDMPSTDSTNETRAEMYEYFAHAFRPGILAVLDYALNNVTETLLISYIPGTAGNLITATSELSRARDQDIVDNIDIQMFVDIAYSQSSPAFYKGEVPNSPSIWECLFEMADLIRANRPLEQQRDYFENSIQIWVPKFTQEFIKAGTTSPEVNTFYQRLTEGFVEFIDQEAQLFVRSETPPEVSQSFVTSIMPTGRIAFVWDQEDKAEWDIYVMNVDGSNQSRPTETGGAGLPAWSP